VILLCGARRYEVAPRSLPDVEDLGGGTFLRRDESGSLVFHCVRDGDIIHLFWQGTVYRLEVEGERSRRSQRVATGGVEAPMPGKVIAIKTRVGESVKKGDEILVVESMKMENAIRAPREGRIKSIAAALGEMVGPGRVLVEIE
jgi:acetyl/propionyl-CoA carboxylase alpha subunit